MNQSDQNRAIIALLERLKQEWPWIEHIYIIRGSPLDPKRYKSIILNTRRNETLKSIPIKSITNTVREPPEDRMAAVWIEGIEPASEGNYTISVWIIGQNLQEQFEGRPVWIRGRLHRKGKVTVRFQGNEASAESFAGLATNLTPFLVPVAGKRVGCLPRLDDHYWFWLNSRSLWTVTGTKDQFYFQEYLTEGGQLRKAFSSAKSTQRIRGSAFQFSRQAQYFFWGDVTKEGNRCRVINSVKSNQTIRRVVLPDEQEYFDQEWLNDSEWVEYRQDKDDLIVDIYDIYHDEKIRSYRHPRINPATNPLRHMGLSEQGELVLVHDFDESEKRLVKISFVSLNRPHLRTIVVRVPGTGDQDQTILSPDGKWLVWQLDVSGPDGFFKRGSLWVSRVNGREARLITHFLDVRAGHSHLERRREFKWRQDSAVLASTWGDCLYSFPV